jgi:2'-5' RNA ligase
MMSVELLLDGGSDAAVRAQWEALLQADLPSQARHPGASNAPHITLLAAESIDTDGLDAVAAALPLTVTLGGWVVFGAAPRGLVLARLVAPSAELLVVHRLVHGLARNVEAPSSTSVPGAWSPHVTLASRLTPEQLASAVTVLGYAEPITATTVAARHWNGTTKTVTGLSST